MNKKVGIIGLGIIGSAVYQVFPEAHCYDPNIGNYQMGSGKVINGERAKQEVKNCDIAFICVPTPVQGDLPYRSDGLSMKIVRGWKFHNPAGNALMKLTQLISVSM